MRIQPGGTELMAARWTQAALAGPNGRTSKEMPWAKPLSMTQDYQPKITN